MAGILKSGGAFLQSPAAGVAMGALGAAGKTYKGNQAAMASQDPALMIQNNPGLDPRRAQGMGASLQFMGSHPNAGKGGMGASSLANTMVDSGATLTSGQGKALSPQVKQNLQGQGAVNPSFMQNMMNPQMLMSLLQLFGSGQNTPDEEETQAPTGV